MSRTSALALGFLGLTLAACNHTRSGPIQEFATLQEQNLGRTVRVMGVLRGGVTGPIVKSDDFSLLTLAHEPWEPAQPLEQVVVTGVLARNTGRMESNVILPYVLTDVVWRSAEGKVMPNMPRMLYVRPVNPGAVYEDQDQR